MDIETMQTVYLVATTGSFSAAANMIPCSQPTISRRIKLAEEELGIPIFKRHSNHQLVTVTAEGRQIVEEFSRIIHQYNGLLTKFREKPDDLFLKPVVLGLAYNTMVTSVGVDALYSDFLSLHPNTCLTIEEDTEENIYGLLNTGKIGLALFVRFLWDASKPFIQYYMDDNLRVSNFARHEILISASARSEIAGKSSITMKELSDVTFVNSDSILDSKTHFVFYEACRLAGFKTKLLVLHHPSRAARSQAVAAGLGSTYCGLPERLRAYPDTVYIPLSDAPFHAEFYLVSSKGSDDRSFELIESWLKTCFA